MSSFKASHPHQSIKNYRPNCICSKYSEFCSVKNGQFVNHKLLDCAKHSATKSPLDEKEIIWGMQTAWLPRHRTFNTNKKINLGLHIIWTSRLEHTLSCSAKVTDIQGKHVLRLIKNGNATIVAVNVKQYRKKRYNKDSNDIVHNIDNNDWILASIARSVRNSTVPFSASVTFLFLTSLKYS